jgi:hypothetical protein
MQINNVKLDTKMIIGLLQLVKRLVINLGAFIKVSQLSATNIVISESAIKVFLFTLHRF